METMVLERTTPVDAILSFIGAERVTIRKDVDKITWTPEDDYINPDDYDSETDYLCALPGVVERLNRAHNDPNTEFKPVSRKFFDV